MSIIYEVNLEVENQVLEDYKTWLRLHINDLLKIDGFIEAKWFQTEKSSSSSTSYCVQYHLKDRAAMESYLGNQANSMRQEAIDKFGNLFKANRRILTPVEEFIP